MPPNRAAKYFDLERRLQHAVQPCIRPKKAGLRKISSAFFGRIHFLRKLKKSTVPPGKFRTGRFLWILIFRSYGTDHIDPSVVSYLTITLRPLTIYNPGAVIALTRTPLMS